MLREGFLNSSIYFLISKTKHFAINQQQKPTFTVGIDKNSKKDFIIIMSSSMKQLAEIVAGFVDRLLVPLIDSSFSSKKRVLEQWNKLKSFIAEAEVV